MYCVISAKVRGNPDLEVMPDVTAMDNEDFRIESNTSDQPVGDGINEQTTWVFDFKGSGNIDEFDPDKPLTEAVLKLGLEPRGKHYITDTVRIQGLEGIPYPFSPEPLVRQDVLIGVPQKIELDLLDSYSSDEIMDIFKQAKKIPMLYEDDAIVQSAELILKQEVIREIHLARLTGEVGSLSLQNEWQAVVTVLVTDTEARPVEDATIIGSWNVFSPILNVATDSNGESRITSPWTPLNRERLEFTVRNILHSVHHYNPDLNFPPNRSIFVERPRR